MNKALLGKKAWRVISEPKSLMAITLLPKYCKEKNFIDYEPKPSDSWVWKSILQGKELCVKGIDIQIWEGN